MKEGLECPECGKLNHEGMGRCQKCGTDLENAEVVNERGTRL